MRKKKENDELKKTFDIVFDAQILQFTHYNNDGKSEISNDYKIIKQPSNGGNRMYVSPKPINKGKHSWIIKFLYQHGCVGVITDYSKCTNDNINFDSNDLGTKFAFGYKGNVPNSTYINKDDEVKIELDFDSNIIKFFVQNTEMAKQSITMNMSYYPAIALCSCGGHCEVIAYTNENFS